MSECERDVSKGCLWCAISPCLVGGVREKERETESVCVKCVCVCDRERCVLRC